MSASLWARDRVLAQAVAADRQGPTPPDEAGEEDGSVAVATLVSADEAVVPALRSALERGWTERLGAALDQFAAQKEGESRALCNAHFDAFAAGADEVARLKAQSAGLRVQLEQLDASLQESGAAAVKGAEALLRFHRVHRHLQEAREELQRATALLGLVHRARRLAATRNYLEALQHVDLVREVVAGASASEDGAKGPPRLHVRATAANSRFVARIEQWVPQALADIKTSVNKALTEWFVSARDKAGAVGQHALEEVGARQLQALSGSTQLGLGPALGLAGAAAAAEGGPDEARRMVTKGTVSGLRSRTSSEALLAWELRDPSSTLDIAEASLLRERMGFAPVHQYLEIHEHLGSQAEAVAFYRRNRLPQASMRTLLTADAARLPPALFLQRHARQLLDKVAGFFVIESALTRAFELISTHELSGLWNDILDEALPLLGEGLAAAAAAATDAAAAAATASTRRSVVPAAASSANEASAALEVVQRVLHLAQLLGRPDAAAVSAAPRRATSAKGGEDAIDAEHAARSVVLPQGGGEGEHVLETGRLVALCVAQRDHVGQLLVALGGAELRRVVAEDTCEPCLLESAKSARAAATARLGLLGLDPDAEERPALSLSEACFPLQLRFSDSVLQLCTVWVDVLDRAFSLARQLGGDLLSARDHRKDSPQQQAQQAQTQLHKEAMSASSFLTAAACAARVADRCLERLNDHLVELVSSDNASTELLCQLQVNLWFLSRTRPALEAYVKSLAALTPEEEARAQQQHQQHQQQQHQQHQQQQQQHWWSIPALARFADTTELAQSRIMQASVIDKVDVLLSMGEGCDWAPEQLANEPHGFVVDAVQYLAVALGAQSAMRLLPKAKRQAAHFTSCGRVSEALLGAVCGTGPSGAKAINALGVAQLRADAELLLRFARGRDAEVPGLHECFAQLEQVATLLSSGDLDGYLNPQTRATKYGYLPPSMLAATLSKYKQPVTGARMFTTTHHLVMLKDSDIKRTLQALAKIA
jgi:hypothetical protein